MTIVESIPCDSYCMTPELIMEFLQQEVLTKANIDTGTLDRLHSAVMRIDEDTVLWSDPDYHVGLWTGLIFLILLLPFLRWTHLIYPSQLILLLVVNRFSLSVLTFWRHDFLLNLDIGYGTSEWGSWTSLNMRGCVKRSRISEIRSTWIGKTEYKW